MTIADQIQGLPPDAIAQVVNAYRDAYDAALERRGAWVSAHQAGAAAFRDALLGAVSRGDASGPEEWRKCPTHPDVDPRTMWGCPDCVAEMRAELTRLRGAASAEPPPPNAGRYGDFRPHDYTIGAACWCGEVNAGPATRSEEHAP